MGGDDDMIWMIVLMITVLIMIVVMKVYYHDYIYHYCTGNDFGAACDFVALNELSLN